MTLRLHNTLVLRLTIQPVRSSCTPCLVGTRNQIPKLRIRTRCAWKTEEAGKVKTLVQGHTAIQSCARSRTQDFCFGNLLVKRPRGSEESSQNKVLGVSRVTTPKIHGLDLERAFASPWSIPYIAFSPPHPWAPTGVEQTVQQCEEVSWKKKTSARLKFATCHFHFYFLLGVPMKRSK